jgi:hypothetical protein
MFENGPVVSAAGDEGHIVPVFGKPDTHDAADASRSNNHESHGQIVPRKRYCRDPNEPIDRISAGLGRFVSLVPDLKAVTGVLAAISRNLNDTNAALVLQKARRTAAQESGDENVNPHRPNHLR